MNDRQCTVQIKTVLVPSADGTRYLQKFQAIVRDYTTSELLFRCSHLHNWKHRRPKGVKRSDAAYQCAENVLAWIKTLVPCAACGKQVPAALASRQRGAAGQGDVFVCDHDCYAQWNRRAPHA